MHFFSKLEDVFVQIIRVVLLAFSAVVLVALALLLIGKVMPETEKKETQSSVAWTDLKPDMQYVVEETGRDVGLAMPNQQLQERLVDPALRPAFQKADQLLRQFVAQKAEQHARIEKDNEARGLADVNPLLMGDAVPDAAAIKAYVQQLQADKAAKEAQEQARQEALDRLMAADAQEEAAAQAALSAFDEPEGCCWTEAVDLSQALHERAANVQSEYGDKGYAAFVLGAPAAMEAVLSNATLAPKLHEMTVSRLVDMVLTNYSISFSRAVSEQASEDSTTLWDSIFSSIELTMWSVIFSFLVLVVFVVMALRMERHLRTISQQQGGPANR